MTAPAKSASNTSSKMKTSPCTMSSFSSLCRTVSLSPPSPVTYSSCRDGSYPTVSSHSGEWSLDPSSHSLAWSIPLVTASDSTRSGSLIFTVGGDDPAAFFPVEVRFNGQGSLAGVGVASVSKVSGGEDPAFSVDAIVTADQYLVV